MTIRTILAGGALALLALPAAAATVVATYTGTVYGSDDQTGVFGGDPSDPGYDPSLDGEEFTLAFTFDTTLGTRETLPGYDSVNGGSVFGTVAPGSASLTINGVSQSVGGDAYSSFYTYDDLYSAFVQDQSVEVVGTQYEEDNDFIYAYYYDPGASLPADLEEPFSLAFGPNTFSGYFGFYDQDCLYDEAIGAYDCTSPQAAGGNLAFSTLTVVVDGVGGPPVGTVPLPASGVLLLAAVGGLPLLRRRQG